MRQPSIIILLISLIFLSSSLSVSATIRGKIDYSIPVDYSKLSTEEVESKAKVYYFNAMKYQDNKINAILSGFFELFSKLSFGKKSKIVLKN